MSNQPVFTPEQLEALESMGVMRDTTRSRESLFSHGEEAEMRATAADLGFNTKQQRELTHRFRRRWLPLLAYGFMMVLIALTLGYTRTALVQHSNQNRTALAAAVRQVLVFNCRRGNDLRRTLRHIVVSNIPTVRDEVQAGRLTLQEGNKAIARIYATRDDLKNTNCESLYLKVR